MKEFYETIIKDGNFKTALTLKKMLDDLPHYLVERIIYRFENERAPFQKLLAWKQGAIFEHTDFREADLKIMVWVEAYTYSFLFFDGKYKERGERSR